MTEIVTSTVSRRIRTNEKEGGINFMAISLLGQVERRTIRNRPNLPALPPTRPCVLPEKKKFALPAEKGPFAAMRWQRPLRK
jgi:hypothetical protein